MSPSVYQCSLGNIFITEIHLVRVSFSLGPRAAGPFSVIFDKMIMTVRLHNIDNVVSQDFPLLCHNTMGFPPMI